MSDERGTTFQSVDEYRPYYTVTVPAGICPLHYLIGDDSTSLESVLLDVVRSANTGVQRDERARPRGRIPQHVLAAGEDYVREYLRNRAVGLLGVELRPLRHNLECGLPLNPLIRAHNLQVIHT